MKQDSKGTREQDSILHIPFRWKLEDKKMDLTGYVQRILEPLTY